MEYYSGNGWCKKCKQIVNIISKDNKIFKCEFCGIKLKQRSKRKRINLITP